MTKKILLISQNFYPEIGSAGNRAKNIYSLLKKEGCDITILTTDPSYPNKKIYDDSNFWDDDSINLDDVSVKRVKINNSKYSQSIFNRLLYFLEISLRMIYFIGKDKSSYDVIYVTSPPIFIGLVGFYAKIRYKSKLVLEIRDLWPESLKGVKKFNFFPIILFFKKIERSMYKKANAIVVNSKGFIDYITEQGGVSKDKITYIPNSAREFEVTASVKQLQNRKVVYAGNIGLAQDVDILMKLAKMLHSHNVSIDIIGYGMKQKELSRFVEFEELKNVRFISPKTRQECLRIISNYQVGIVTLTNQDVFKTVLPGKVVDYMTCGVPIVGAVSGYSKEVIIKENVGFVSESRNPKEMLDYILRIINSKELYDLFHNNAKNYVQKNLIWENNIKDLKRVISRLS